MNYCCPQLGTRPAARSRRALSLRSQQTATEARRHDIRDRPRLDQGPDGELVRSDVIAWLRCRGSEVETARPDGTTVRLAGPGCPPDFHIALLRELESHGRWHDNRWIITITADITASTARWMSTRLDELAETHSLGG